MTTTILFGLTFVLLVYKVYADEKIETAFDCYKKFRIWDSIVFGVDVFHILHKRGNIIVTPSETYEKVLTAMSEKMFEGSRQDKIDIARQKAIDFQACMFADQRPEWDGASSEMIEIQKAITYYSFSNQSIGEVAEEVDTFEPAEVYTQEPE